MSELRLHIDGVTNEGLGVGRLPDGRVVFVDGALPGDDVCVRLTHVLKKVQHARVVSLDAPSPHRVASACAHPTCGGCASKGLSLAKMGELKRARVLETLRRVGGIDATGLPGAMVQLGDGWRYRHRVRLHAARVGGELRLGFHERGSKRLALLESCPVLWPELEAAAKRLEVALSRCSSVTAVELAWSRRDGQGAAVVVLERDEEIGAVEGLSGLSITGARRETRGELELRYDHRHAGDFTLRFAPDTFTQAFPEVNDALVAAVMDATRGAGRVLEYHAGIGNFSVPLARGGASVTAVERESKATELLRRNAREAGAPIEVVTSADAAALGIDGDADLVLLDPPRTGARELAQHLAAQGPSRVVYVSCDPATLARDLAILRGGGYALQHLSTFDMFPQTPHVETLAVVDKVDAR